jgi:hypothetical protein
MAKTSTTKNGFSPKNSRRKRPGVHAKSKTSYSKRSKNYKKFSRGQG